MSRLCTWFRVLRVRLIVSPLSPCRRGRPAARYNEKTGVYYCGSIGHQNCVSDAMAVRRPMSGQACGDSR